MEIPASLTALIPSNGIFSGILSFDPLIRSFQIGLGVFAALLVFLVFYATRDVLKRSSSLTFQLFSIVLVAALPVVGFLFYLIIRPTQTLRTKQMEKNVEEILNLLKERQEKLQAVRTKAKSAAKRKGESDQKEKANERIVSKAPASVS